MGRRNTRARKSDRKPKTIGRPLRLANKTLHIESPGADGVMHRVAIDCPPELTSLKLLITCTPGVRWYVS